MANRGTVLNTRRQMSEELRAALEAQITASHDAKGFLGATVLKQVVSEMQAEFYQDFLNSAMNPGALMTASTRAQVLDEIYTRIVAAADAGTSAADALAKEAAKG